MSTRLSVRAVDRSTYVVTAAFTDAAGDAVVPNSVTWTLTDVNKAVVNSREDESETPAASLDIVLSGADIDHDDGALRRVVVDAEYDSTEGSGLPLRGVAEFIIDDVD